MYDTPVSGLSSCRIHKALYSAEGSDCSIRKSFDSLMPNTNWGGAKKEVMSESAMAERKLEVVGFKLRIEPLLLRSGRYTNTALSGTAVEVKLLVGPLLDR